MKAVSVDDQKVNLMVIEGMGEELGLDVISFLSPIDALDFIENNEIDVVIVDYKMPNMNGVELVQNIRKYYSDIPIVMITSLKDDEELKLLAIENGATEFLNKPLNKIEFRARMKNLMELRKAQLLLKDRALLLEEEVRKATFKIRDREYETLQVLGNAAEYKDPETAAHIQRMAHYCKIIAEEMFEDSDTVDLIFQASQLHDVGKMGIPDSIMFKPGKLSDEEFDKMKTHSLIGYDMLKKAESEYLRTGAIIALHHHEKYDGSGYPNGLKGENIHVFGRIAAVADVFDALTSRRPYKEPWPIEKAIDLLIDEKGKHFDLKIVEIFVDNLDKVKSILSRYIDEF